MAISVLLLARARVRVLSLLHRLSAGVLARSYQSGVSGNGPIMAGAQRTNDRETMLRTFEHDLVLRMFEQDLEPFVAKFAVAWPMDITEDSVRDAMSQCTTLHELAATLPDEDGDRKRIEAWLFPSVNSWRPLVMRGYWGCISTY